MRVSVFGGSILAVALHGCAAAPQPATFSDADDSIRRLGALQVRGVPDVPADLTERMQQYRNTRDAVFEGWLGDSVVINTRFADTGQLHRVDRPLGARTQMTFFDEPVAEAAIAAAENPRGFIYVRDSGGSEFYQLFWYALADGTSTLLTDGRSRNTDVVWAADGRRFAYTTTARNGRDWDIRLQEPGGAARTALEAQGTGWIVEDFARDGERLLVLHYVSITESYLYQLSLSDGTLRLLTDSARKVAIGHARYAPDGESVLLTSDAGAEFLRLYQLGLADGRLSVLTGDIPWDVEELVFSANGEYLAFTVNEGGYSQLYVWRWPSRARVALPALPAGIVTELAFHPQGDRLGFSLSRPTAPTDVYSIDLAQLALTRWTQSEVGGLDPATFVEPELVSYQTFDAVDGAPRRIPAFVYRPPGPGPHPVYISIHGGPESQYRPYFSPALQYYVNDLGMAVVVPNVRGSSGYGKRYVKLDDAERRPDSVRDIGALLDWIVTQSDLDAERVAVSGGSYGGYMVLASLVHYSDRLAAGVERVGISNFVSFLSNTEAYRQDLRRAEYGDERDPAMRAVLERISPLNNVEHIGRPLLIAQGANDPRVPASESEQIYQALVRRGVPVWYLLALDEGHGFHKKANGDYAAAATVMFLNRFVLGDHAE